MWSAYTGMYTQIWNFCRRKSMRFHAIFNLDRQFMIGRLRLYIEQKITIKNLIHRLIIGRSKYSTASYQIQSQAYKYETKPNLMHTHMKPNSITWFFIFKKNSNSWNQTQVLSAQTIQHNWSLGQFNTSICMLSFPKPMTWLRSSTTQPN
jgi:hypothetical protein